MSTRARELRAGHIFVVRDHKTDKDIRVEVLQDPEEVRDMFGRPELKIWCRRLDTGEEGWVHYGLEAIVQIDLEADASSR